MSNFNNLI